MTNYTFHCDSVAEGYNTTDHESWSFCVRDILDIVYLSSHCQSISAKGIRIQMKAIVENIRVGNVFNWYQNSNKM